MKRLFFILFSLLTIDFLVAQTPKEQLHVHQQWCKTHVPSPKGMSDAELLETVAWLTDQGLTDPEALDIYRTAGRLDPVFSSFADLLEMKRPDENLRTESQVLQRMYELADSLYRDNLYLWAYCALQQAVNLDNSQWGDEGEKLLERVISRLSGAAVGSREDALLCLCRCNLLMMQLCNFEETPDSWNRLIDLERKSWEIDQSSRTGDVIKADIHILLLSIYICSAQSLYTTERVRAFGDYIGKDTTDTRMLMYPHFNAVDRLAKHSFTPYHPMIRTMANARGYLYACSGDRDSLQQMLPELKLEIEFNRLYYGTNMLKYVDSKSDYLLLRCLAGEKNLSFSFDVNSLYFDYISLLTAPEKWRRSRLVTVCNLATYEEDSEDYRKMAQLLEACNPTDVAPKHQVIYSMNLLDYYTYIETDTLRKMAFYQRIDSLYLHNHRPEWTWVNLGTNLYLHYARCSINRADAGPIMEAQVADYAALRENADSFDLAARVLYATSYCKTAEDQPVFLELLQISQQKQIYRFDVLRAYANYLNNLGQLEEALLYNKEALRQADTQEQRTDVCAMIASIYQNLNNQDSAFRYLREAEPAIMAEQPDIRSHYALMYPQVLFYYIQTQQYDKADTLFTTLYRQYISYKYLDLSFIMLMGYYTDYCARIKKDVNLAYTLVEDAADTFNDQQARYPLFRIILAELNILTQCSFGDYTRFAKLYTRARNLYNKMEDTTPEIGYDVRPEMLASLYSIFNRWIILPYFSISQSIRTARQQGQSVPPEFLNAELSMHGLIDAVLAELQSDFNLSEVGKDEMQLLNDCKKLETLALCREALGESPTTIPKLYKQLLATIRGKNDMQEDYYVKTYLAYLDRIGNLKAEAPYIDWLVQEVDKDYIQQSLDNAISTYGWIMGYYEKTRHWEKAVPYALKNYERLRSTLDASIYGMTTLQRTTFLNLYGTGNNHLQELLPHLPEQLASVAYDATLYEKGIQVRAMERIRQALLSSADTSLISLVEQLNAVNEQLKKTQVETHDSMSNDDVVTFDEYVVLRHQQTQLERQLTRKAAPILTQMGGQQCLWTDVQQALKPDEAAIEFVNSTCTYSALLIRKDSKSPQFIPLMSEKDTLLSNRIIAALLDNTHPDRSSHALYATDSFRLYEKLWQPLLPYLKGVTHCYVSMSGIFTRLNLPLVHNPAGGIIQDSMDLAMLTTTAELQKRQLTDTISSSSRLRHALYTLYGGIFYNEVQQDVYAEEQTWDMIPDDTTAEHRGYGETMGRFPYLRGTYQELRQISSSLHEFGVSAAHVRTYSGAEATEESFRRLSGASPDILHIGTHGFYVADVTDMTNNGFLQRHGTAKYDAMQRTGLLFYDADDAWQGYSSETDTHDGIITSSEVADMNLQNVSLLVLSACQTAQGDIQRDGVSGLQRGFKQAGVQAIMASLWNVNDIATRDFMAHFYHCLLETGNRHQAYVKTVDYMRRKYEQPYYWAPFILLDAY